MHLYITRHLLFKFILKGKYSILWSFPKKKIRIDDIHDTSWGWIRSIFEIWFKFKCMNLSTYDNDSKTFHVNITYLKKKRKNKKHSYMIWQYLYFRQLCITKWKFNFIVKVDVKERENFWNYIIIAISIVHLCILSRYLIEIFTNY